MRFVEVVYEEKLVIMLRLPCPPVLKTIDYCGVCVCVCVGGGGGGGGGTFCTKGGQSALG